MGILYRIEEYTDACKGCGLHLTQFHQIGRCTAEDFLKVVKSIIFFIDSDDHAQYCGYLIKTGDISAHQGHITCSGKILISNDADVRCSTTCLNDIYPLIEVLFTTWMRANPDDVIVKGVQENVLPLLRKDDMRKIGEIERALNKGIFIA